MKAFELPLSRALQNGLRPYDRSIRNNEYLEECHNLAPMEGGVEAHETITPLNSSGIAWGGEGQYTPSSITRTITIRVTDYTDDAELEDVTVYLDGNSEGTTDANGELEIADVEVGGHELKLTKTGYQDSDADTLFNDYIFVI